MQSYGSSGFAAEGDLDNFNTPEGRELKKCLFHKDCGLGSVKPV